jgi:hypothetical protein
MRIHPQLKAGRKLGYVIYNRNTMEVVSPTAFAPYVYPFEAEVPSRFLNQTAAQTAIERYYPNRPELAVVPFANYVQHMAKTTGVEITQDLY